MKGTIAPIRVGNLVSESRVSPACQCIPPWETIMVNDGPRDANANVIRAFGVNAKLLYTEGLRPAEARNVGMGIVGRDWLAFLDNVTSTIPAYLAPLGA